METLSGLLVIALQNTANFDTPKDYAMVELDHEGILLDENQSISIQELAELSHFSLEELRTLIESGALIPQSAIQGELMFNSHQITLVRKLSRLRHDFELELNALGLVLILFDRIRMLEQQVKDH